MRNGLGMVLLVCLITRIAAELVTPALPLVATLLFLAFIFTLIFGGPGRRRW